ncbi:MAG: urease accessory protein UreD [Pseudomonadota bacterium]
MYANTSPSDDRQLPVSTWPHQRVDAAAAVSFKYDGCRTRLERLYQQGSAKVRFPKHYGEPLEAVLINTAGGLTGGDRLGWDITLNNHSNVVLTTQACEKSYQSVSGTAHVQTTIKLEEGSTLHWLPQETILYEKSSLSRRFNVELAEGSEFLAVESLMLGREAMGETVGDISFHDRWRIKRGAKMIFADDVRLAGSGKTIASFGNNRAAASMLFVSSQDDEALKAIADNLRKACPAQFAGFSAFNGKISGRILAADSYNLRHALASVLKCLRDTELPRVWRI